MSNNNNYYTPSPIWAFFPLWIILIVIIASQHPHK